MALTCILRGKILEVRETLMSFTSTKHTYWYYDTETWLRSLSGREGARPDYPMRPNEVEWVKKHYLPRAIVLSDTQDVTATGRILRTTPQVQTLPLQTEEGGRVKKAFFPTRNT